MILKDTQLDKVQSLMSKSNKDIEYILLHFDFNYKKNCQEVVKYFTPVYFYENLSNKKLQEFLKNHFALVIYDKKKVDYQKRHNVFQTVLDVIYSNFPKMREFEKDLIRESIDKHTDGLKNYQSFLDYQNVVKSIMYTKSILDKLFAEFETLNKYFLTDDYTYKIANKHLDFNVKLYRKLSKVKQREYIKKHFEDRNEGDFLIVNRKQVENVGNLLEKFHLRKLFRSYIFTDENELFVEVNEFTDDDVEYMFNRTVEYLLENEYPIDLYSNVDRIFLQIQRTIEFINLYRLEYEYGVQFGRNTLFKLYERIGQNKIGKIKDSPVITSKFIDISLADINKLDEDLAYYEEIIRYAIENEEYYYDSVDGLDVNYHESEYERIGDVEFSVDEKVQIVLYQVKKQLIEAYHHNSSPDKLYDSELKGKDEKLFSKNNSCEELLSKPKKIKIKPTEKIIFEI